MYNAAIAEGSDDDNCEVFKDEVALPTIKCQWQHKYQPRKPAYLNKVKTGYDWNRYNQSHYDKENPPPKVVQGYQFNIFYNDLIDPNCTPKYWLEASPDNNPNFCIIRFSAGPPYQDIAFKIVQKKWQTSPQRGFRCNFVRGVFSLWFNFNRIWYRR
uniref:Uncharacterized protein C19orf29 n=1 Tax=Lygus hesperus TaxID=30085 RepID=A0A146KWR8_LYGHE